jgi:hypothetical protein
MTPEEREEKRIREEAHGRKRNDYLRGQVMPRLGELTSTWRARVPIALGLLAGILLPFFVTVDAKISDVAGVGINYAALSFGGCITGAVLTISLPSETRVRRWASQRSKDGYFSAYNDLVFWLTWAALSQLAVLFASIVAVVIGGGEDLIPARAFLTHRLLLGLCLALFFYAAVQLLTLVGTISQMGNIIDYEEWKAAEKKLGGLEQQGS